MLGQTFQDLIHYNKLSTKLRYGFKRCRLRRQALIDALDNLELSKLHTEFFAFPKRKRMSDAYLKVAHTPPKDDGQRDRNRRYW